MAISMALLPPAALMVAELFLSLRRGEWDSGLSGQFIPSGANRTAVFLMAGCYLMVRVTSTEPPIMAGLMVSALFTNCRAGPSANGTSTYSIASKREAMAIAPSAILLWIRLAISMELRARVVWAVAPFLS